MPSTRNVLRLAKSLLQSAAGHGNKQKNNKESTTAFFHELATALNDASTNASSTSSSSARSMPLPRTPVPFRSTQQRQEELEQLESITASAAAAAAIRMADGVSSASIVVPNKPPLSKANATYGATPAETIRTLLDSILPPAADDDKLLLYKKGLFVDAGSGMGEPTLVAALSNRFSRARGVEYDSKHYSHAMLLKKAYDNHVAAQQLQSKSQEEKSFCELEYICGDMSTPGFFCNATVVFANAVMFDAELCRSVSERLEKHVTNNGALVVSMSRRFALPSFDLVDMLTLPANGGGNFTLYVSQRHHQDHASKECSSSSSTTKRHFAMTDTVSMRALREADGGSTMEQLVSLAVGTDAGHDHHVDNDGDTTNASRSSRSSSSSLAGLCLLAALAKSEPTARFLLAANNKSQSDLFSFLIQSLGPGSDLPQRASASMVLRTLVDHPVGRRAISSGTCGVQVTDAILCALEEPNEHPAVVSNLFDILGNTLNDSSLDNFSLRLDKVLANVKDEAQKQQGHREVLEAADEVEEMRRWWRGEQRRSHSFRQSL